MADYERNTPNRAAKEDRELIVAHTTSAFDALAARAISPLQGLRSLLEDRSEPQPFDTRNSALGLREVVEPFRALTAPLCQRLYPMAGRLLTCAHEAEVVSSFIRAATLITREQKEEDEAAADGAGPADYCPDAVSAATTVAIHGSAIIHTSRVKDLEQEMVKYGVHAQGAAASGNPSDAGLTLALTIASNTFLVQGALRLQQKPFILGQELKNELQHLLQREDTMLRAGVHRDECVLSDTEKIILALQTIHTRQLESLQQTLTTLKQDLLLILDHPPT